MRDSFSVVIPAFNEEDRIQRTLRRVGQYMATQSAPYEIIVADDGSQDATREIVAVLQKEGLPIKLLTAQTNRGKGSAVRRGVAAAGGNLILITDADLATPIEELERLLNGLSDDVGIVIGSRGLEASQLIVRQSPLRESLGRFLNLIVRLTILPGVRDTQCGFKLFRKAVARQLFAHSTIDGFAYDIEVLGLAARRGYRIVEVPVRWSHVKHSKLRVMRDGPKMLRDLVKIGLRLRNSRYVWVEPTPPVMDQPPGIVE